MAALVERLPEDTLISITNHPLKVSVSMTISNVDEALALQEAISLVFVPILEIGAKRAAARNAEKPPDTEAHDLTEGGKNG